MAKLLDNLRRWIDGDNGTENILHEVDTKESKSQELLRKVLMAISDVLQEEVIQLPSGKVYIPSHFVVYLNPADDKGLRKDKREFFEQALGELVLEKAREIVGKGQLNTQKLGISLKVNGTLSNNEILVEAISADDDVTDELLTQKGEREKNLSELDRKFQEEIGRKFNEIIIDDLTDPAIPDDVTLLDDDVDEATLHDDGTIPDRNSALILYRVEVAKDGKAVETVPIIKSEILVGRESSACQANIRLHSDNRYISSSHLMLMMNEKRELFARSVTGNQTLVDGKPLAKNEQTMLDKTSEIKIYEFTLRVKF
jgi:hypothetical protein